MKTIKELQDYFIENVGTILYSHQRCMALKHTIDGVIYVEAHKDNALIEYNLRNWQDYITEDMSTEPYITTFDRLIENAMSLISDYVLCENKPTKTEKYCNYLALFLSGEGLPKMNDAEKTDFILWCSRIVKYEVFVRISQSLIA